MVFFDVGVMFGNIFELKMGQCVFACEIGFLTASFLHYYYLIIIIRTDDDKILIFLVEEMK
jgi:hypothetical protein